MHCVATRPVRYPGYNRQDAIMHPHSCFVDPAGHIFDSHSIARCMGHTINQMLDDALRARESTRPTAYLAGSYRVTLFRACRQSGSSSSSTTKSSLSYSSSSCLMRFAPRPASTAFQTAEVQLCSKKAVVLTDVDYLAVPAGQQTSKHVWGG